MISRSELARLAELQSSDGIVSLYLRIEPRLAYESGLAPTKFKSALTRFLRHGPEARWQRAAERERDRILRYLETHDSTGRGLALFACEPADIWEAVWLEVTVPTSLEVDSTSRTGLLACVLDEYPRLAVAVVQRDKARIYLAEQGRSDEKASMESDVGNAHSKGGWSQARLERRVELQASQHWKEVVSELSRLHREQPFRRLALGGTDEATAELARLLPEELEAKLVGSFPVDVKHAGEDEILARARELGARREREEEDALVSEILGGAAAGARGVVGIEETIRAVQEGRVQKMALVDDVDTSGYSCSSCGFFAAGELERCSACGSKVERTDGILELALERAYLAGAHVEFVFGEARKKLLERGGAGALLRY